MDPLLHHHKESEQPTSLFPDEQPGTEPLLFAGPCSAESEEQVDRTAAALAQLGVRYFRAGIWKPRSKPGGFEGVGTPGLQWLRHVGDRYRLRVGTEVGTAEHARQALDHGLDFVWIGARTTTSPFAVSEIAEVLEGEEITVLVKNPIAPDPDLWIGAIRRFMEKGVTRLAAVHRGFSVGANALLRNLPLWSEVDRVRECLPHLPILCDPSHIAGRADLVPIIVQEARDRSYDGLFIEVHPDPPHALSDAAQQLTPEQLGQLMTTPETGRPGDELDRLRLVLDSLDEEIIRLLAERARTTREIGAWKDLHRLSHHQPDREEELYRTRAELARLYGLSPELAKELYHTIHKHSIRLQDDEATKHSRE